LLIVLEVYGLFTSELESFSTGNHVFYNTPYSEKPEVSSFPYADYEECFKAGKEIWCVVKEGEKSPRYCDD
jgi:hypothetical protein